MPSLTAFIPVLGPVLTALVTTSLALWAVQRELKGRRADLKRAEEERRRQTQEDRSSAALLIWSEVRLIERASREWIQKWSRRHRPDARYVPADPGSPIAVQLPDDLFNTQLARLAHFSPSLLEQLVFFYRTLPVYRIVMARSVNPPLAVSIEDVHRNLHAALELEARAHDLANRIWKEVGLSSDPPRHVRPVDLQMYVNLYETTDGYLDFGSKETFGAEDRPVILEVGRRNRGA